MGTIGQPAASPAAMPAHRFRRVATVRKMVVALVLAVMKKDDCDGDDDDDDEEEDQEGSHVWLLSFLLW